MNERPPESNSGGFKPIYGTRLRWEALGRDSDTSGNPLVGYAITFQVALARLGALWHNAGF
jgi:hypothetical protein